jgi:hypothetical protein
VIANPYGTYYWVLDPDEVGMDGARDESRRGSGRREWHSSFIEEPLTESGVGIELTTSSLQESRPRRRRVRSVKLSDD